MKKLLKFLGTLLLLLVVFALGLYAYASHDTGRAQAKVYEIAAPTFAASGTPEEAERGRNVVAAMGCKECHKADLGGGVVIDGGPIGVIVAPNISPGAPQAPRSLAHFERVVRHAVSADGHPLVFMPSEDYDELSDADVAAMYTYLRGEPAVATVQPPSSIGPLAKVLHLFGRFPLFPAEIIDHAKASAPKSEPAHEVTAEYGRYLAQVCTGCHRGDLSGGLQMAPGTPVTANLTPDASGLKGWTEADFLVAMRDGKRPNGTLIDPFMPWRTFSHMGEVELKALWAYLQTLPPTPKPKT